MMDSITLTHRVADRFPQGVPMRDGGIDLHPVIKVVLEVLAEEGFLRIDVPPEER